MCFEKSDWIAQSLQMLHKISDVAARYPSSFGYWSRLLQTQAYKFKIVVCSGSEVKEKAVELLTHYLPQAYILTSEKEIFDLPVFKDKYFKDEIHIFVCTQESCLQPVGNIPQALSNINYY
jgi:uncharacterized protein YyaL (SSP411 family)